MDGWLDGWMDRNIRMVADAMKLTALVGQVDVKSNRNRWWRDREKERGRESKRDRLKEDLKPRLCGQLLGADVWRKFIIVQIWGASRLFRGQKKLLIAQMVMVIKKHLAKLVAAAALLLSARPGQHTNIVSVWQLGKRQATTTTNRARPLCLGLASHRGTRLPDCHYMLYSSLPLSLFHSSPLLSFMSSLTLAEPR